MSAQCGKCRTQTQISQCCISNAMWTLQDNPLSMGVDSREEGAKQNSVFTVRIQSL